MAVQPTSQPKQPKLNVCKQCAFQCHDYAYMIEHVAMKHNSNQPEIHYDPAQDGYRLGDKFLSRPEIEAIKTEPRKDKLFEEILNEGLDSVRGRNVWTDIIEGKKLEPVQPEPSLREKVAEEFGLETVGSEKECLVTYVKTSGGEFEIESYVNYSLELDKIMKLFADDKAQAVAEARIGKVQDKNFHRMVKAMGDRLYELATIPKMPRAQFDKEIVPMAADIYALGFRDINDLINTAQKKLLDDIYALSPTKNFEHWKPQDALQFYERLKGLETRLTEGGKS